VLFMAVPIAPWLAGLSIVGAAMTYGPKSTMAVATAVAALAVVAMPGPILPRTGCQVSGSESGSNIVLYSHNVQWSEGVPVDVARQILSVDPDVVLLQEADDAFLADLTPLLGGRYPHQATTIGQRTTSMATLSRWPLAEVFDTMTEPWDENPFLFTTVSTPSGELRLANVHLSAPVSSRNRERREREFAVIEAAEAVRGLDLLIGDFNASSAHRDLRRLIERGYADGHREVGCGLGLTWSRRGGGWPSVLSLDHLFTGGDVTPVAYQVLDYASSDHKAIAAEISLNG
jgi:endonuclease/exonuclease/phosphatase (EEP) superfamily protein YafD